MKTAQDLRQVVRQKFPAVATKADELYIEAWGELDNEFAYSWFESLANVLNNEMNRERPCAGHKALFDLMSEALVDAEEEIYRCIDVAFVENLFWQVPSRKSASYWQAMPKSLRDLYLSFHGREP